MSAAGRISSSICCSAARRIIRTGEAREIWQQLGASFGSDTNARTDPTQTVYRARPAPCRPRASSTRSLRVLADMMSQARFEPAAVDAERPVVLAEKGRRPELSVRFSEIGRRALLCRPALRRSATRSAPTRR